MSRLALFVALTAAVGLSAPSARASSPSTDFNGDGYGDIAIGTPFQTVDGHLGGAGSVQVIYGGAGGLDIATNQHFNENTPGIGGPGVTGVDPGDLFGNALATGDFNHDGYSDLAIGAPGQPVDGRNAAGAVYVLFGGAHGLRPRHHQYLNEGSPGIKTDPVADDQFGYSLAAGRLAGHGRDDLAVGARGEHVPARASASVGGVHVIPGSGSGLSGRKDQLLEKFHGAFHAYQLAEAGSSLTVADLNGDGRQDLAVGSPHWGPERGGVDVFYQRHHHLRLNGSDFITEDSRGLAGPGSVLDNEFGFSLAAGDFSADGRPDLAIGSPGAPASGSSNGAVHVLYGSRQGILDRGHNQYLSEVTPGIKGPPGSTFAEFGFALAAGRFNNHPGEDLAVGAPFENVLQTSDGGVHVLRGGHHGLVASSDQHLTQKLPSLADGGAHTGDELGFALAANDLNADAHPELLIDKVELGDNDLGCNNAGGGIVHVIPGGGRRLAVSGNQAFSLDTPGMLGGPSQPCERFGAGLAAVAPR